MVRGVGGIEDSLESSAKPEVGPNIASIEAHKPGDSLESSAKPRGGPEASVGGAKPGDSLRSSAKHNAKQVEPIKLALEPHSVCGGRPGWKSSQAVTTGRVAGAVPSLERGEGCVNTQTGSVGVAASQSNTLQRAFGEGGSSVNTQTGSVRVADSQSNNVFEDLVCEKYEKCEKCEKYEISEECTEQEGVRASSAKNPYSMKSKNKSVQDSVQDNVCDMPCLSRGTVSTRNMNSNADRKPSRGSEVRSNSTLKSSLNSTLRLKEYFSKLNNTHKHTGEGGRGGNLKQGSKLITPTKRKLGESKQVSQLVKVFNHCQDLHESSPGESYEYVGSPAKRPRMWGQTPLQPRDKGR